MADEGNIIKIKVQDEIFTLNFDDIEIDEMGTVEDLTGRSMNEIDWTSARGMQGIVWIVKHRQDPRFTLQDAGKLRFGQVEDAPPAEGDKPKRPTKAASSGGTS